MRKGLFHSAREAKEFLVYRIVEEAARENVPLSEVERKMLYFSETDWTLPDIMEVNDQFDREYDQDEYEQKIARFVSKAARHDRKESGEQYDAWWDAIRLLEKQDHYILVMIRAAGLRPRFDQLKLFIAGLVTAAALVGAGFLNDFVAKKYGVHMGKWIPSGESVFYYVWVGGLALADVYLLLRIIVGADKAEDLFSKVIDGVIREKR
jgi:hypothetical protein